VPDRGGCSDWWTHTHSLLCSEAGIHVALSLLVKFYSFVSMRIVA